MSIRRDFTAALRDLPDPVLDEQEDVAPWWAAWAEGDWIVNALLAVIAGLVLVCVVAQLVIWWAGR